MGDTRIKAGEAYVEIGAEDRELDRALSGARVKIDKFAARIDTLGKGLLKFGLLMAVPLGFAVKQAADFEEISSKFHAVFKEFSSDAKLWAEAYADAVGRSAPEMMAFMARLQDTFVPMGFARDKALELSKTMVKLGIDLGSFNNEADAEVIHGLTSAIVGNHEAVRRWGINITENSLKLELLNLGINKSAKELTNLDKVTARLSIIMKSSADAQGDAIRTAGSFTNRMKALRAAAMGLAVTVGSVLLPPLTKFLKQGIQVAKTFRDWIRDHPKIITGFAKIATTLLGAGTALIVISRLLRVVTVMMSPAGILGAAVLTTLALAEAFGLVDVGINDVISSITGLTLKDIGTALLGDLMNIYAWLKTMWRVLPEAWDVVLESWKYSFRQFGAILVDGFTQTFLDVAKAWFRVSGFLQDKIAAFMEWIGVEGAVVARGQMRRREAQQQQKQLAAIAGFGAGVAGGLRKPGLEPGARAVQNLIQTYQEAIELAYEEFAEYSTGIADLLKQEHKARKNVTKDLTDEEKARIEAIEALKTELKTITGKGPALPGMSEMIAKAELGIGGAAAVGTRLPYRAEFIAGRGSIEQKQLDELQQIRGSSLVSSEALQRLATYGPYGRYAD